MLVGILYIRHLIYRHYVERVEESAENACTYIVDLSVRISTIHSIYYSIPYPVWSRRKSSLFHHESYTRVHDGRGSQILESETYQHICWSCFDLYSLGAPE